MHRVALKYGVVGRARRADHKRWQRGAAALLEVVLALSILLVCMSVVGLTFSNGQHNVELTDLMTRAMMQTERLIAELDTGILTMEDREQWGWFGEESVPGMSWAVEINPHENMKDLIDIDIHIYMGDPSGTDDERKRILSTRIQRPEPRGIDFEKDFGLEQEEIDALTEAIPGGAAVFDPTDFDPRMLASLTLDELVDLLPTLIQAMPGLFAGGQFDGLIQSALKGDFSSLENIGQETKGQGESGGSGGESGDQE